jgi:hypothetical protein
VAAFFTFSNPNPFFMKLDANRGKSAAIDTGAAIAGAVAAHALTNFASEKVMASNPTSTIGKYIPLMVAGVCIGVQAMGIVPRGNDALDSALLGASAVAGMSALRELTGANDDTKNTAGVAKLVAQYVPSLSGTGLGNAPTYLPYNEMALAQSGRNQFMLTEGNGWPAAPAQPVVKFREVA